jgi:hypothetical protein
VTTRRHDVDTVAAVDNYVVRVWLPDRPGALGQVASRIGAVRGDVVGIDILERGSGLAVDDLVVSLPDGTSVDLLVGEILQVDGVAVEDIRAVAPDRPDAGIVALEVAARVTEADADKRLELLCRELLELVDGEWAVASVVHEHRSVITIGSPPDPAWIGAFLAGASHLGEADLASSLPGDLAWARLPNHDIGIAIGRSGRPFHTRERVQVTLLGRIADSLVA